MSACICGGLLEFWIAAVVLPILGVAATEAWNRWRHRCHCRKRVVEGTRNRRRLMLSHILSWIICDTFERDVGKFTRYDPEATLTRKMRMGIAIGIY